MLLEACIQITFAELVSDSSEALGGTGRVIFLKQGAGCTDVLSLRNFTQLCSYDVCVFLYVCCLAIQLTLKQKIRFMKNKNTNFARVSMKEKTYIKMIAYQGEKWEWGAELK